MRKEVKKHDDYLHLRIAPEDKALIDRAAKLVGANRTEFVLSCTLAEAKNLLLDQSELYVSNHRFQQILEWLDSEPSEEELGEMRKLKNMEPVWGREV